MLNELKTVNDRFVSLLKKTDGILAAWYFGSLKHKTTDEYSDIDIVILSENFAFEKTDRKLAEMLESVCDKVILQWGEDFNSESVRNYDHILSLDGKCFQYDVFLLNNDHIDDYMCRLHYTGLTVDDIIFSAENAAERLIGNAPKGDRFTADIKRTAETYWLHVFMSVKYFLRKDFFKLNGILRILMDSHTAFLLTEYDTTTWGGTANKLHFIPDEKQRHLMKYGCSENFELMKANLLWSAEQFEKDISEAVTDAELSEYCSSLAKLVKGYFIDSL